MIRYLDHKDKDKWEKLYHAFADFYKVPMNSPILDNLFVDPEFRGQQIAQKLIGHLKSLSKANNWNGVRWITHSSNENAKKLYDKIANNTGFELYELKGD